MSRQIYRQEALERLSSPEQLDMLMPVTDSRGWIALSGVGLLLLAALVWGVFGTVDSTVQGSGLLMRYGGFDWIAAPAAGRVTEILVKEGDQVREGDVVAKLASAGLDGDGEVLEIKSPRDGRVLDLVVIEGGVVLASSLLLSVESPDDPLQAVVYVPASDGYRVKDGLEVKVLPATENQQSSNYLRGRVRSASKYPATDIEMMQSLQSESWVASLLSLGPTLEVIVEITATGNQGHLYSGTPCRASIIIQRRRPIEFLAPVSGK